MIKNILLIFISFLFTCIFMEVVVTFKYHGKLPFQYSKFSFEDLKILGKKSMTFENKVFDPDGKVLSKTLANHNEIGLRVTSENKKANKAVIFLGGSYVYGEGLQDHQTLPFIVGEKNQSIQTFNYGESAYGPNNVLRLINKIDLDEQIPNSLNKINVYFFSYPFHAKRYLGSIGWVGQIKTNDPYYTLEQGRLVYKGNFANGRFFKTAFLWLAHRLNFLYLIMVDSPKLWGSKSQKLLCAMANQMNRELSKKLGSRFNKLIFVNSPFKNNLKTEKVAAEYYQGTKLCLDKEIVYLEVKPPSDYNSNLSKYVLDKDYDWHPNEYANQWLAQQINWSDF